jgi:hypothetical protein
MSAASLLSTYTGVNPAVLVVDGANGGGPGAPPNIAAVLAVAPAGAAGGLPLTDVGAFTCDTIASTNAGLFTIAQTTAGQGIALTGALGASITATTGGASITATAGGVQIEAKAGVLELDFDGVGGELKITPLAAAFTNAAGAAGPNGPTYAAGIKQLQIKIGAVDYWIALNAAAFA